MTTLTCAIPCESRRIEPIVDGVVPFLAILRICASTWDEVVLSHAGFAREYGILLLEIPFPLLCMRPMIAVLTVSTGRCGVGKDRLSCRRDVWMQGLTFVRWYEFCVCSQSRADAKNYHAARAGSECQLRSSPQNSSASLPCLQPHRILFCQCDFTSSRNADTITRRCVACNVSTCTHMPLLAP